MSYGDLTGAFPYTSSRGNKYLYVMYDHDSNGILVAPLKNGNANTIVEAWKFLYDKLTKHVMEEWEASPFSTLVFILSYKGR